jgi:hypothetical protein
VKCNGSGVISVFRKSGEPIAGRGVSGVSGMSGDSLVADRGGVKGVEIVVGIVVGVRVVIGGSVIVLSWRRLGEGGVMGIRVLMVEVEVVEARLSSMSFRRECWRFILRRVLGV